MNFILSTWSSLPAKTSCFSSIKSWYITAYFHQTTCKKYASSHFTQQSLLLRSAHLTSKEAKPFLKSLSSTALLFSDFVTRRARLSLPFRAHAVFFVSRSKRKATKDLLSSMLLTGFHLLKDNAKEGGDGGAVKRLKTPKLTAQQYHNFSLLFALIALLSFVLDQSARIHSFHGYADLNTYSDSAPGSDSTAETIQTSSVSWLFPLLAALTCSLYLSIKVSLQQAQFIHHSIGCLMHMHASLSSNRVRRTPVR